MLDRLTLGGNPLSGRLSPVAERHARDFENLLGKLEAGEAVETGAQSPDEPGEVEHIRRVISGEREFDAAPICPSAMSDGEIMAALQENGWGE